MLRRCAYGCHKIIGHLSLRLAKNLDQITAEATVTVVSSDVTQRLATVSNLDESELTGTQRRGHLIYDAQDTIGDTVERR